MQSLLHRSVVEAIGNTPIVELRNITANLDGRIVAKLECANPGTSKKDRIARQIILAAMEAGELPPGRPIIELTSGSTGTGAALVCAALKRRFIAVMSEGNSKERAVMMQALGAEVVLVPQAAGSVIGQVSGEDLQLVEDRVEEMREALGAFRIDQFNRHENSLAHETGTGREILNACEGQVRAFCDFVGSGGTFAGLWRAFKEHDPAISGYVVEPADCAVLAGGDPSQTNHRIQGGGYAMKELPLLGEIKPDGFLSITDQQAITAARRLAAEEGIFGGFSSGANLAAAIELLEGPERGGTVAILVCDTGLKYMSTDLWKPLS